MIKLSFDNKEFSEIKEKTSEFLLLIGDDIDTPVEISHRTGAPEVYIEMGAFELRLVGKSIIEKVAGMCERIYVPEYEEPEVHRGAWVGDVPWPKANPDLKLLMEDFGDVSMLVQHFGVGNAENQFPAPYITFVPHMAICGNLKRQISEAPTIVRLGFLPSGADALSQLAAVCRSALHPDNAPKQE